MPTIAERLDSLTARHPDRLDLAMAAVAQLAPDGPNEDTVVAELDRLATGVDDEPSIDVVVGHVFGRLAFRGDTEGYHRPSNSYIHHVLARRRGIPITLAAVASEVGRRLGVPLTVIGMPGHVVMGDGPVPRRWFDPFAGGAELDEDGCRTLFGRIHPAGRFDPAMVVTPMPTTAFVSRMLNNLKVSHHRSGDLPQLARVLAVSSELTWSPPSERLELAKVLAAAGRDDDAARVWDQLAELDPSRAASHRAAADRHRARRN